MGLLQVFLNDGAGPELRGLGVLVELAPRPALAEEIVVAIELHVDLAEPLVVGSFHSAAFGLFEQAMFFGDEVFDVLLDVGIVHARGTSVARRPRPVGRPPGGPGQNRRSTVTLKARPWSA